MNLLFLIFLHHVGDVWAQPSWLILNKKIHWFSVYEHAVVYTGVVSLGLYTLGILSIWKILFILLGHFIIDFVKYRYLKNWNWIYLDQGLHYLQLIFVFYS